MAKKTVSGIDQYTNKARLAVATDSANTLTVNQLITGTRPDDNVAWLVQGIDWHVPEAVQGLMTADGDYIRGALVTSDAVTTLLPTTASILFFKQWTKRIYGTPANADIYEMPYEQRFTDMPGGGFLIPAESLFLAIDTDGLASNASISAILYYTKIDIGRDNYTDLLRSSKLLS